MGLFSIFKRPAPGATPGAGSALDVDAARTRARRRLIGAVLLLGIGVIAFPVLFETQPRPIAVDLPIEIPRKDGAPPLALPALPAVRPAAPVLAVTPPAAAIATETKADAGRETTAPAEAVAPAAVKPEPTVKPAPAVPAKAAASAPPSPAEAPGRFVVQVGAFADTSVAREARSKVEKLGLRTYTQVVDTDAGQRTRVRLGPYASRDEAEKSAAKVKAAGLPAAVLAL